jgi:tetratricopeptide (TPR) repeat protein
MASRGNELAAALLLHKMSMMVSEIQNEESNLLHARRIALKEKWLHVVPQIMDPLRELYEETGQHQRWRALVEEITPYYVDLDTDLPLPGLEIRYHSITDFRALVARKAKDYAEAERLQKIFLEWFSRSGNATAHDTYDRLETDGVEKYAEETRAIDSALQESINRRARTSALNNQGIALIELDDPRCVPVLEEAFKVAQLNDDLLGQVASSFNLSKAFIEISVIADLDKAELWAQHALDLCPKDDLWRLGKCHNRLGQIAFFRTEEELEESEGVEQLNNSYHHLTLALKLLPEHCIDDRAETLDLLATLLTQTGYIDEALGHYRESLRLRESSGNRMSAATTRMFMAEALARAGRTAEAREFTKTALQNFASLGEDGEWGVRRASKLLKNL